MKKCENQDVVVLRRLLARAGRASGPGISDLAERLDTAGTVHVLPIDQGHERAGVNEDAAHRVSPSRQTGTSRPFARTGQSAG
jgi:hypothetical protein